MIPDRPAMRSFWHPASTLVRRGQDSRRRRSAAEWLRLEALGARDVDVAPTALGHAAA